MQYLTDKFPFFKLNECQRKFKITKNPHSYKNENNKK